MSAFLQPLLFALYGGMAFVALGNLLLMRRPKGSAAVGFQVMIPARNEAQNLPLLVPPLVQQGISVTVFDDASEDGTAEVATRLGACVCSTSEALPAGWTGKNRACHELSAHAEAPWVVFLDADTRPDPEFGSRLSETLQKMPPEIGVVSGFPRMIPGAGLEPLYLSWVPWILLASNPFWLISLSGKGHCRFLNGQFVAWRRELLEEFRPYEQVRSEVLEDVKLGRLLAKKNIRVEVLALVEVLSVRMYRDLPEAWRGMLKNSHAIAGSKVGSALLIQWLLFLSWGWAFVDARWTLLAMLIGLKFATDRAARLPLWLVPFFPLTGTAAALTILASTVLHGRGGVEWKGRRYV